MWAYFKQSKINCNAIYWIIAVKACFYEHTKNNGVKSTQLCCGVVGPSAGTQTPRTTTGHRNSNSNK